MNRPSMQGRRICSQHSSSIVSAEGCRVYAYTQVPGVCVPHAECHVCRPPKLCKAERPHKGNDASSRVQPASVDVILSCIFRDARQNPATSTVRLHNITQRKEEKTWCNGVAAGSRLSLLVARSPLGRMSFALSTAVFLSTVDANITQDTPCTLFCTTPPPSLSPHVQVSSLFSASVCASVPPKI